MNHNSVMAKNTIPFNILSKFYLQDFRPLSANHIMPLSGKLKIND